MSSLIDKIKGMISIEDPYSDLYEQSEGAEEMIQNKNIDSSTVSETEVSKQPDSVIELKVIRPTAFANVIEIADYLLGNCSVVLNLELVDDEVAKRLLDFLAGVAYSIGGQMKNVAFNTYIVTPCNFDIADTQTQIEEQPSGENVHLTNTLF